MEDLELTALLAMIEKIVNFIGNNTDSIAAVFTQLSKLNCSDFALITYSGIGNYLNRPAPPTDKCVAPESRFSFLNYIFRKENLKAFRNDGMESVVAFKKKRVWPELFTMTDFTSLDSNIHLFLACALAAVLYRVRLDNLGTSIVITFFGALSDAIEQEKISKAIAQILIRRLRQKGVAIPIYI